MCLYKALLICFVAVIAAEQVSYEGYKVYRVHPLKKQVELLAHFDDNKHFDFLSPLRRDGYPVDVMVDPDVQNKFVSFLEKNNVKYEILTENVERVIQEERRHQLMTPRLNGRNISFTKYHRHDEINAYLDQLAEDYSNLVSLETIGKSYEGRDLKLIKISTNPKSNKPVIFIDAGIHAREWAAPPVALYTINQLVENTENLNLLEKVDFHILPVVNPDGYEYTHEKERFWRKTRSPGTNCYGTDGNRNYEYHWGEIGSSGNGCSEIYHGKHPFSEVETSAIRDYVLRNKDNIRLYLSLHTYGQMILYPWSYTEEPPEDSDELQAVGELAAASIKSVSGTRYVVGGSTVILNPTAGSSDDWVKAVGGVALSYTVELPGGGSGFDPPPTQILPIVTETWEGIKAFNHYIANKFG